MDYNFLEIEPKWRKFWAENKTFKTEDQSEKPKYYVLDMFPYPSGAGLHVGHPLGYIASDIYARYKRLQGYNVLHPMGYDSFGLPAEQYAIQTGQHPAITTEENVARYRDQLDKIGFSFDWDREVRTSSPEYYKWTQWIFIQLFDCWYNNTSDKAERISDLIQVFETEGNAGVNACTDCSTVFTVAEWKAFTKPEQEAILQEYRLAYLADSWVNWCPNLGTVLANDEIVNGVSERGGHPVEQKLMRQWSMRIKAYAERLLTGLEKVDWTDSIKDIQRNWIGKSIGASVSFECESSTDFIEVFTTRPDTIYGVSFMVLAPEHPLVEKITTAEYKEAVEAYRTAASLKSERDRQADVKNITGQFTGAYAKHPFTGDKVQIWIGDYVLASYGTGAVMAVPCGDQRDWDFAKHFKIEIKNIFADIDISEAAYTEKEGTIANSDFLSGLSVKEAMVKAIAAIEEKGIGKGKTNYRLRDAVFSRQRYWGEPFPVYYKDGLPVMIEKDHLPVVLPEVEKYLPTPDGQPPLGNATTWAWDTTKHQVVSNDLIDHTTVFPLELNTMPGWAGSSWYFLRYMDSKNEQDFVSKSKADYWKNVDLYIGGSEHGTGHLLYSRFWTKFLCDQGFIQFDEPFQKMINQGMILGTSEKCFMVRDYNYPETLQLVKSYMSKYNFGEVEYFFIDSDVIKESNISEGINPVHVPIEFVDSNKLKIIPFFNSSNIDNRLKQVAFLGKNGVFMNGKFYGIEEELFSFKTFSEVEKMSKSKFNVQTPDELVDKFGADTLRMYEMFLGPLEQSKPWDTKGINGVHNFLRKLCRLFEQELTDATPSKESLKTLHKTIKKVSDDLERFSFNTGVSNFMICVNELTEQKCSNKAILKELIILLSPYAPHLCEELWVKLDQEAGTLSYATFPTFDESHLVEANFAYPVSFNGKMRFKVELPLSLTPKEVEQEVMSKDEAKKYLEGKEPKKIIVVPGRIVNVVM
jgi:leucyl-tRNA synthetase